MFSVRLNNVVFDFSLPPTILQACLTKAIYIPRFCYHYSLRIAGNCRMCLVEEKSSLKPLASCAVTIVNGHIIYTNTEAVRRAREGVLEYLLINHPLDCPICDQGGECDLQDQTMVFGADRGRFYEHKRSTPNKNLGFLIKTFLNRCIHCARCTRFLEEVAGTNELQLLGRGYKTEISNYISGFVKSEISGNIVDLCPVGALTSKPYSFRARPWELLSVYTNDILEGSGSSVQLDFRGLDLMRILPKTNRFLNEEWISDRTRFSYDAFNVQRLTCVYIVSGENYQKSGWSSALFLLKNVLFWGGLTDSHVSFGDFLDLESTLALKNLFSTSLLKPLIGEGASPSVDFRVDFGIQNMDLIDINHDQIEKFSYSICNTNLRFESPVLNLRPRKILSNHENPIFVVGFLSNLNFEYWHIGRAVSTRVLNFLSGGGENRVLLSGSPLGCRKPTNVISQNLTTLSRWELNGPRGYSLGAPSCLSLNAGQPEARPAVVGSVVKALLLHHVETAHSSPCGQKLTLLLPSSFYYEKATSYLTNSFTFFNLLTQFGLKLPNTKPEYRFLNAFSEFLNGRRKSPNMGFFVPRPEFRLVDFFNLDGRGDHFFRVPGRRSLINNFYLSNIVSRASAITNLCSSRLLLINDYIYSTIS